MIQPHVFSGAPVLLSGWKVPCRGRCTALRRHSRGLPLIVLGAAVLPELLIGAAAFLGKVRVGHAALA
jgi:hypothetical protein